MSDPDAAFYFDLASPIAYLAAERVLQVLPIRAEWQPVLAQELGGDESFDLATVERTAHAQNLQPLKWPDPFPFDSALAMRQAFAGGRSLEDPNYVLIAAAACEMHPAAVLKGAQLRSVTDQLSTATTLAARAGVTAVPAVRIGAEVFVGERAVENAAAHAGPIETR
jgi:2-hydroxychromene-2-carboxylate isomerase